MEILWGPDNSSGLKEKVEQKRLHRRKMNQAQQEGYTAALIEVTKVRAGNL